MLRSFVGHGMCNGLFNVLCALLIFFPLMSLAWATEMSMENAFEQLKFWIMVVGALLASVSGLLALLYKVTVNKMGDDLGALRTLMETHVNGLGGRVNVAERKLESVGNDVSYIKEHYMSKDDHDRICER